MTQLDVKEGDEKQNETTDVLPRKAGGLKEKRWMTEDLRSM